MRLETDVLVIGGGATGAGLAFDLVLRGVRCVLTEMNDLTTGTSGRYHGLLHSGARYCVRDLESAKECIDENLLLRKLAPHVIENTSGFFVGLPEDDPTFEQKWLDGCKASGIPFEQISPAAARKREPVLSPRVHKVYEVPDGTCDSFDLGHALKLGVEQGGGRVLTYHRVDDFIREGNRIVGAQVTDLRSNTVVEIRCRVVVIAAGPWSEALGRKAGMSFKMKLSRGANLAFNVRWVNTVINRLRKPGDGDIFVPVGTVSVVGTTSVATEDPSDTRVEAWEVARILGEMEPVTPGLTKARILRAWAGVRPLYDPGGGDQRSAARTFQVLDSASDGVEGVIAIIGGKLTTYRLMAEKAADIVCTKLNITAPCSTARTELPNPHGKSHNSFHQLKDRLNKLEHGETQGALLCECEMVTAPQVVEALGKGDVVSMNDLRRDLRLGMGPCQGGFCAFRGAAVRHQTVNDTAENTCALLGDFVERRFSGVKPLLWGHNLRQALLAEHIYGRILGLSADGSAAAFPQMPAQASVPQWSAAQRHTAPKVVIVGAGLAGLTAALVASNAGLRVEAIAQGQGMLALMPGWFELGDVETLAQNPEHPYAKTRSALGNGLAALSQVLDIAPGPFEAVTALGGLRHVGVEAGGTLYNLTHNDQIVIVGIAGWRDFYAKLVADRLQAQGCRVSSAEVQVPHIGGNFDAWPLDFANWLDTDAGLNLFVERVKPHVRGATVVALPAVLGFNAKTLERLSQGLGANVLEIPTLPPSVPGMRLYQRLRQTLLDRAVRVTIGPRVVGLVKEGARVTGVQIETAANGRPRVLHGDAVILCTGGLYGGGLDSDYQGKVWETIADLPVSHVPPLGEWFTGAFLGGSPQPIHHAGLSTDAQVRPLGADGTAYAQNLYAAGRLLAGYSPVAEHSSEGVDIASATFAVQQVLAAVGTVVAG
jgi:glycerol-3-phosphate dehydrogenase